ncbi:hypothetical protein E4U42_002935 [Claviceps africana]|uniref:Uncharacterized protein n=1 Tax=Claviceps africana TaxID=83212 RepID=A0A8K0NJ80_9HYPO|nr:hypothetical protein E4U42_002935 [Claviceps africana]
MPPRILPPDAASDPASRSLCFQDPSNPVPPSPLPKPSHARSLNPASLQRRSPSKNGFSAVGGLAQVEDRYSFHRGMNAFRRTSLDDHPAASV